MKNLFTLISAIYFTTFVFAQAPQKMSYQAVIHNSSNNLVTNQVIGIRISILQGSITGNSVYIETQTPTSNSNGLVSLEIGGGSVVTGSFATINWASGPYYIKTETDPAGGTNYSISGTTQLLSIPYALYAKVAGTANVSFNDINNKPNTIAGYGITDAVTANYVAALENRLSTLEKAVFIQITDFDGNVYNTVKIGNQYWLSENLKSTHYADGSPIVGVYAYNNDESLVNTYGRLYTWAAVMNGAGSSTGNPSGVKGICPDGWHVPSNMEWAELFYFLGGNETVGGKLKEAGNGHWWSPNEGATNSVGFNAIPGGLMYQNYGSQMGGDAYFWTTRENDSNYAWLIHLQNSLSSMIFEGYQKDMALSCRCVKD